MFWVITYTFGLAVSLLLTLAAIGLPARRPSVRWTFAAMSAIVAASQLSYYFMFAAETGTGLGTAPGPVIGLIGSLGWALAGSAMTPSMLLFAYAYVRGWPPRWAFASLSAISMLRAAFRLGGLIVPGGVLAPGAAAAATVFFDVFEYACAGAALYLVVTAAWSGHTPGGRRQAVLLTLAGSLPLLGGIATEIISTPGAPVQNLGMAFMWVLELALAVEVFRFGFLDVLPGALTAGLDDLSDAVLVLDRTRHVVAYSRRARELFDDLDVGRFAGTVLPELSTLHLTVGRTAVFEACPGDRIFAVRAVRLGERSPIPGGSLVLIGDTTELRRKELELASLNAQLEHRLAELEEARAESDLRREELALANERLRELGRAKDRFLANISHELRTPLNSIIGFSGIMLAGMTGSVNDEQARQLEMISGAGHSLLALINELLDISRIEAGRVSLQFEEVHARSVLDAVATQLRALARDKDLTLEVGASDGGTLVTDRARLQQILLNLGGNAVKFTDSGSITLSAARDGDSVVFAVADTGPGIPPERLDAIFERFEQLERDAGKPAGTGLGLSIARELARLLGGDVTVDSELGRGSTFRVRLPIDRRGTGRR